MIYRRGDDSSPAHEVCFSEGKSNGRAVIVRYAHNRALGQRPYRLNFNSCNHPVKLLFISLRKILRRLRLRQLLLLFHL